MTLTNSTSKTLRELFFVTVVAFVLTYLAFLWLGVQFDKISTAYFGDYGDTLLNSWTLHQAMENLLQRPTDLGYSPIFYGYPQSFAYTIAPYGIAISVLPFHLLTGSNIILTYNVYLFATFVLTAVSGYLLIRHLTGASFTAALIGALMITFSQFRFQHFVQIESLSFHLLLFALFGFYKLLQTTSARWLIFTAVCVTLTLTTSGYLTVMFITAASITALYMLFKRRDLLTRRRILSVAGAAVLTGVLAYPLLSFRLHNPDFMQGAGISETMQYSSSLNGWLTGYSQLYFDKVIPYREEVSVFIGVVPLLLAAFAWKQRGSVAAASPSPSLFSTREIVVLTGLTILTGYVLSLGPVARLFDIPLLPMPYLLIGQLPLFSNTRVPARFIILAIMGTAVLAALFLDYLSRNMSPRRYKIGLTLIVLILTVELLPPVVHEPIGIIEAAQIPTEQRVRYPITPDEKLPVYAWLADQPAGTPIIQYPNDYWVLQQYIVTLPLHGQPMFNGHGSFLPDGWEHFNWETFPDAAGIREIQNKGIRYLLVHHHFMSPDAIEQVQQRIDQFPDCLTFFQTFAGVEVYAINPSCEPVDS